MKAPTSDLRTALALPGPAAPPISLDAVNALLRGLDAEQRRAVTHGEGPLLIVAGPGTGKTRVVTRRIAWLIATKRARPSEILALTFTDKAAAEMQARVDELVPYGHNDTAIHTFHAFGDRLVREYAFELGLPGEPRVLSRADAVLFLRERLFELGLERYRPLGDPTRFLGALVGLFSRAKDEGVDPAAYEAYAARLARDAEPALAGAADEAAREAAAALLEEAGRQAELAHAYGRYQALLAGSGLLDFGDQVALAVRLLREHPAVRAEVQQRFRYVLVDELQDTNPAQLDLVELVAGGPRNVTAVGDDDQAIYTFRGAALGNVLGFTGRFPGARRLVLRRNHRSRPPILETAYRLVRHNDPVRLEVQEGLDKRPRAVRRARGAGNVVQHAFGTLAEETDWIARTIAERVAAGARPRDFAVLVRTNADVDAVRRSLNLAGVPWRSEAGSGLYGRPEVRELLAFLRVVAEPDSTVDLYALATAEPYRLGGSDLTALLGLARRRHRSLWWGLGEVEAQPGLLRLSDETRRAMGRLLADLRAACELAHRRPAGEVLYDHLRRSGRLARLVAAETAGDAEALQNVARFFELVRSRARLLPEDRVAYLAPHLQAIIEAGDDPASAELDETLDGVAVLTVHRAKGLEFPVVFVAGLVEGRFPTRGRPDPLALPAALRRDRSSLEEAAHAEERRLCYVALTRARDELILTWAADGGSGRMRRPSPFLAEALDLPAAMPAMPDREARLQRLAALEGSPQAVAASARRVAPDGTLTLSYSALDDYLGCPARYRLRHVLGVPVPPHHALAYGTALHAAVAAFGQQRQRGRTMSEQELLEVLAAHWSPDGFLSREHEEARFEAGREALRRYHAAQLAAGAPVPAAVEEGFAFELDGVRLRGRFDRVDETPEGVVITDFKSSDVRDPAKAKARARDSLQLAIYALAHESATGTLPAAVQLHFLDSGLVGRVAPEPARLEKARQRISRAAQGIAAGEFTATPDQMACGYCPFRDICPDSAAR